MSELRLKRHHISGYIDDFYVQGQTYNECQLGTIEAVKLFDQLGYVIHPIKNSLIPSQQIEHLSFVINYVKMTVTLTESKKHNLRVMISDVLNSHSITIRQIAQLVGELVSTFPASAYGPLYYRNIECDKTHALSLNQGNYNAYITLSDGAKDDLHWWLQNISDMYKPIQLPSISVEFSSDASKYDGWGVVMENVSTGGAWTASEFEIHINIRDDCHFLWLTIVCR